jgi:hypothetical protein
MASAPGFMAKLILLTVASFLTLYAMLGVFGRRDGYTDALFEPDYTILHAPEDGPLAEAGFQSGDSVITVEGMPVQELGMYSRWPRSLARSPGESLSITVERNGELISGDVVFREQPSSIKRMQIGLLVVLLSFLWAGVWVFLKSSSVHAASLAAVGLAAGFAIPGPSLGTWDGLADHVNVAAEVLLLLLLFRFLLLFPRPKKLGYARLSTAVMYAPWIVLVGCLVVELVFHPLFYHSFGGLIGLAMLFYFLSGLMALVHSWIKTPWADLGASGLGWVLAGMGLGIGGVLLWAVDALFMTGFDIPGSNWAPVLFAMVPVGMALGVRRATVGNR